MNIPKHMLPILGSSLSTLFLLCSCSTLSTKPNDDTRARTAKINAQLGIAYLEQHNIPRAKKKLLAALKQDDTIPETWYSMAYFLETTGNRAEADRYYQKAIEVGHGRGDAENNYGTFLCRGGQYEASIKHFTLAAKDPEYLSPADAYENAGLCASKIAGDNHAAQYFNQALIQDPERPTSWMALAELDYKSGRFKAAHENLKQFLQVSAPTERSMALNAKLEEKMKLLA